MPEADVSKAEKNFYIDVPQKGEVFFLKGSITYFDFIKSNYFRYSGWYPVIL